MDQTCINGSETLAAIASGAVVLASTVANFVPEPDKIDNGVLRFLSRVLHFVALDIVTAKQPK